MFMNERSYLHPGRLNKMSPRMAAVRGGFIRQKFMVAVNKSQISEPSGRGSNTPAMRQFCNDCLRPHPYEYLMFWLIRHPHPRHESSPLCNSPSTYRRIGRICRSAAMLWPNQSCSALNTRISTRRFFAWFSGSLGSAGRSQPMPAALN